MNKYLQIIFNFYYCNIIIMIIVIVVVVIFVIINISLL